MDFPIATRTSVIVALH